MLSIPGTMEIKMEIPVTYLVPETLKLVVEMDKVYVDVTVPGRPVELLSLEVAATRGLVSVKGVENMIGM